MNYTDFMTSTTFQAKSRTRPMSTTRGALPARGNDTAKGMERGRQAEMAKGFRGPTAFSGNPADYEKKPVKSQPRLKAARRQAAKRAAKQLESAVARILSVDAIVQNIIERKVEEALAQRNLAQSSALSAARERGAKWAHDEYVSSENLSLDDAAEETKIASRYINERRNAWSYYALLPQGQTRGFRYPKWQFDADINRLAEVLAVLRDGGAGCWTVHSFMIAPNTQLEGLAPRDWILDSAKDLERLLQVARARFTSDQGAG